MKKIATIQNHYPIFARQKALSKRAAILEILIIAQLEPSDDEFYSVKITKDQLLEYGVLFNNKNYVRELKVLVDEIRNYTIELPVDNANQTHKWRFLLDGCDVYKNYDIVIKVNEAVGPYLLNLKGNFYQIDIYSLIRLKGRYPKILYGVFKSCEYRGKGHITIENLRNALGLTDDLYKNFAHFNDRILKSSVEEINKNSTIIVSYKSHKIINKVTEITFTVDTNIKNIELNPQIKEVKRDFLSNNARKILDSYKWNNDKFLLNLIQSYGNDTFEQAIFLFDKRYKNYTTRNKAGVFHNRINYYITEVRRVNETKKKIRSVIKNEKIADEIFQKSVQADEEFGILFLKYYYKEIYEACPTFFKTVYDFDDPSTANSLPIISQSTQFGIEKGDYERRIPIEELKLAKSNLSYIE